MEMILDDKISRKAEKVCAGLGLDLPTAVNIFMHKIVEVRGLPFAVAEEPPLPDRSGIRNKDTREAFEEVDRLERDLRLGRRKIRPTAEVLEELDALVRG